MTTNMYINELDLHQSMYVAKTMCSEEKDFICVNSYIITVNFLLISKIYSWNWGKWKIVDKEF